jgi:uncharacterized membrane protein
MRGETTVGDVVAVWEAADWWVRASVLALVWAVVVQALFVGTYGFRRPWRQHFAGRALMLKSTVVGIALALTLINTFWVYPFEEQIGAVLLILIAASVTYQYAALLLTRRR